MIRNVVGILLAAQALRGLGYGVAAVQLGVILRADGLSPAEVGLMLAAILAGTFAASLVLARWGDRVGRRRAYAALYGALACCGIVIAVAALVGWTAHKPAPQICRSRGGHGGDGGPAPLISDDALHHAQPSRRSAGRILAVGLVVWWLPVAVVALLGALLTTWVTGLGAVQRPTARAG
ncbi:hypothetical protein AB0L65_59130 [Nonomuraea sp. NPDC052116]|uniref:hypothetical protein n=1 Tax=Nonomuraea sp. NPDC052116 TaxID=3155665 RepID=UPI003443D6D5